MGLRIQAELNDERADELYELMRETGALNHSALINAAIRLLRWAKTETQNGRVIASVDEAGKKYKPPDTDFLKVTPSPAP